MASAGFFKVKVTHILDPENFWAQIHADQDSLAKFDSIETSLQQFCSGAPEENLDVDSLDMGQMVLVKAPQYQKWLRAKVSNIVPPDVDVYFVDYGSMEQVDGSAVLTQIPPQFSLETWVPCLYRCKIAGVKPIAREYTRRAVTEFSELVLNNVLDASMVNLISDSNICVIDILVEEDGSVQSLTYLLLNDGLARSDSPKQETKPGLEKAVIQGFNLSQLERQVSKTSTEENALSPEAKPDIEQQIFLRDIDTSGAFAYAPSDRTLGKSFKPNVSGEEVDDIRSHIREMEGRDSTDGEDSSDFVDAVPFSEGSRHSSRCRGVSPGDQSQNRDRKATPSPHGSSGVENASESEDNRPKSKDGIRKRFGRGRGSPPSNLNQMESVRPGSRDISPLAHSASEADPGVKVMRRGSKEEIQMTVTKPANSQSAGSQQKFVKKQASEDADTTDADQGKRSTRNAAVAGLESNKNENHTFAKKMKKLLKQMTVDNLDELQLELVLLVHPAKSSHHPTGSATERMAHCLDHALTRAIEEPAFIPCAIRISLAFCHDADYEKVLSDLLWKMQKEHVKPSSRLHDKQLCINYCNLLSLLYLEAMEWGDPASETMLNSMVGVLEKWALANKKGHHTKPHEVLELYTQCTYNVLSRVGPSLKQARPQQMQKIMEEIKEKLLANDIKREVKSKFLDLILGYSTHWTSSGLLPPSPDMAVPEGPKASHQPSAAVRAARRRELVNAATQTEDAGKPDNVSQSNRSSSGDTFRQVRQMLKELGLMDELYDYFVEYGIRDSCLHMRFTELKELLYECDFLPGHIYEIRAYLNRLDTSCSQSYLGANQSRSGSRSAALSRSSSAGFDSRCQEDYYQRDYADSRNRQAPRYPHREQYDEEPRAQRGSEGRYMSQDHSYVRGTDEDAGGDGTGQRVKYVDAFEDKYASDEQEYGSRPGRDCYRDGYGQSDKAYGRRYPGRYEEGSGAEGDDDESQGQYSDDDREDRWNRKYRGKPSHNSHPASQSQRDNTSSECSPKGSSERQKEYRERPYSREMNAAQGSKLEKTPEADNVPSLEYVDAFEEKVRANDDSGGEKSPYPSRMMSQMSYSVDQAARLHQDQQATYKPVTPEREPERLYPQYHQKADNAANSHDKFRNERGRFRPNGPNVFESKYEHRSNADNNWRSRNERAMGIQNNWPNLEDSRKNVNGRGGWMDKDRAQNGDPKNHTSDFRPRLREAQQNSEMFQMSKMADYVPSTIMGQRDEDNMPFPVSPSKKRDLFFRTMKCTVCGQTDHKTAECPNIANHFIL